MHNISSVKEWVQYFLLPIFIFVFSTTTTFVNNANSEDVEETEPANNYATTLEAALNKYKEISANGGWPQFPTGKSIKLDAKDTRIPIVRDILSITGDYHIEEVADPETLDKNLADAVAKFQERHGLEADGAIGAKTQAALAVPVESRIAQMEATLERMKDARDFGDRYVLVNLPEYYLKAVENNNVVLKSRIIVGTPKNATPLFEQPITDVSFNPAWHVPPSIARNELTPKLRSNPSYFVRGNYVITDSKGKKINATSVDWNSASAKNLNFVQRPSSSNALGKIKFNLPDTNNIYLHSTGSPQLFDKTERALSHGCIRVEMARELAHFVMNGMEGWDVEKIDNLYDSRTSKILPVEPVPVYLVYWTSWADAEGKPHFRSDIYGRDKKRVAEILAEMKNSSEKEEVKLAMN